MYNVTEQRAARPLTWEPPECTAQNGRAGPQESRDHSATEWGLTRTLPITVRGVGGEKRKKARRQDTNVPN